MSAIKIIKNSKGAGLTQVLLAAGLSVATVQAAYSVYQTGFKLNLKVNTENNLLQLRSYLVDFMRDSEALLLAAASTPGNASLRCTWDDATECVVGSPNQIKVNTTANDIINLIGSDLNGVTRDVQICPLSKAHCDFRLKMDWEPICPHSVSSCNPRQIYVSAHLHRRDIHGRAPSAFQEDAEFTVRRVVKVNTLSNLPPSPPPPPTPVDPVTQDPVTPASEPLKLAQGFETAWSTYCSDGFGEFYQAPWVIPTDPLHASPGAPSIVLTGADPAIPYKNFSTLSATGMTSLELSSINYVHTPSSATEIYAAVKELEGLLMTGNARIKTDKIGEVNNVTEAVIDAGVAANIRNISSLYGKFGEVGEITNITSANVQVEKMGPTRVASIGDLYLDGKDVTTLDQNGGGSSCIVVDTIETLNSISQSVLILQARDSLGDVTIDSATTVELKAPSIRDFQASSIVHLKLYGTSSTPLLITNASVANQTAAFLEHAQVQKMRAKNLSQATFTNVIVDELIVESPLNIRLRGYSQIKRITFVGSGHSLNIKKDDPFDPMFLDIDTIAGPFSSLDIANVHVRETIGMSGMLVTSGGATVDVVTP